MHKYKTELCKQWSTTGKCPYFHRCMFAHDVPELMQPGHIHKKLMYRKLIANQNQGQNHGQNHGQNQAKFILNPNAKKFEPMIKTTDNLDYELYWNIIHNMILQEQNLIH